ncbi:HAD family hydrolase (plasmid) [Embleya sp. NBC_00888]|uniref:D-glycero-alpha-D-manno-heptose-1,7-bisphosphate 7-phosphatase n=1 Tax=Embleya sp. NBC_00888 TaxID=2975960 RepID=UPI002F9133BD|nr:HAD family hydrolase [Embleya sp. NBC_00888]
MSNRPAVFLDRDGTLTEPRHYPSRPEHLVLQGGIGPPLRILQEAGYALVVATNQSGIARGLFTLADLDAMHRRLRSMLVDVGVRIDGIYACPHHPEGTVPPHTIACHCRKPEPGLLHQAARELHLDLTRSWMLGDSPCDTEAGNRAGCRTIFVGPGAPANIGEMNAPTTAQALRALWRTLQRGPGYAGCATPPPPSPPSSGC